MVTCGMALSGLFEKLIAISTSMLPSMELPEDLSLEDGLPVLLVLIIVALVSIYAFTNLFTDPEGAVDFDVPEPEQLRSDWKGEILEIPSIKVDSTSSNDRRIFADIC